MNEKQDDKRPLQEIKLGVVSECGVDILAVLWM